MNRATTPCGLLTKLTAFMHSAAGRNAMVWNVWVLTADTAMVGCSNVVATIR
jgi:hypothetical protein